MKLFKLLSIMSHKFKEDNLSAFAAEATLFIIMSAVPFLILLMTLLKYTTLTEDVLLSIMYNITPLTLQSSFQDLISQMYDNTTTTFILITLLSILWAAGKGFVSIIDGLNAVYKISSKKNWIIVRLLAISYTIIFLITIILSLLGYILSTQLYSLLVYYFPLISGFLDQAFNYRIIFSIVLFTFLFTFLYVIIPRRKARIRYQIPGAFLSAIGWTFFSYFFSIYVEYSQNLSFMYGSLTSIVCTMLWLYTCMYIFLVGAEFNLLLEKGKKIREKQTLLNE